MLTLPLADAAATLRHVSGQRYILLIDIITALRRVTRSDV